MLRNWLISVPVLLHLSTCEISVEKSTFDRGNDDWTMDNNSWIRTPFQNISRIYSGVDVPTPVDGNESIVLVPTDSNMAIMYKNLSVPGNTNLEVFFSCLAIGWKSGGGFIARMNNPLLQVLYDEVTVFNLDSAITENSKQYSSGKWNQFRLFSSYESNFTMRVTIMGSMGRSHNKDGNLIAIDNVLVKMVSNSSRNVTSFKHEPEADLQKQDGTWEKISLETEEEEADAVKNGSVKMKPEFCDLLAEPGPCHGSWPRYYFDSDSNECKSFTYGGCNGNENNFHVKLACEAICQTPEKKEDDSIFDIIFGSPFLSPDDSHEVADEPRLRNESQMPPVHNITTSFDDGFQDWNSKYFRLFVFNSTLANSVGITKPSNASSSTGASPTYTHNTIFRRPHLMHAIHLKLEMNLTVTFSLMLLGEINPLLHPFFENVNPGFKVYIGDFLVFDYVLAGELDQDWHKYQISKSTTAILDFPHLTNRGSNMQIIRIEAWRGNGDKGYIVLDDLSFIQTPVSISSGSETTTTTMTSTTTSEIVPTTTNRKKEDSLPFPCFLPQRAGPCTMSRKRYSFDQKDRQCKPFTYGGCKGNANNFLSYQTCMDQCKLGNESVVEDNVCDMAKNVGQCNSRIRRFYFNKQLGRCVLFFYGGCGGNGNNFESRAKCDEACGEPMATTATGRPLVVSSGTTTTTTTPPSTATVHPAMKKIGCILPPPSKKDLQNCVNNLGELYFFHNVKSLTCEIEVGCAAEHPDGQVVNQFASRAECENTCIAEGPPPLDFKIKTCLLAPLEGPCRDYSTRYFYDVEQGACNKFAFGGCHGNMNNFRTQNACMKFCGNAELKARLNETERNSSAVCYLSKDAGRCRGSIPRFFYDPNSKSCRPFEFGGCSGNENRFVSEQDCIVRCMPWISEDKVESLAKAGMKEQGTSPLVAAEIVLGIFLIIIFLVAAGLAIRYYRIYKEKENYRIFNNQQNRSDSISSLSTNAIGVAYDNPVFGNDDGLAANNNNNSTAVDPELNGPGPESFPLSNSSSTRGPSSLGCF